MMVLVIWLTVLVVAFTLYLKEKYSKFKRKGVNGPKPIPIIGTGWTVYLGKEHMADYLIRMYQSFPNERFYGNFELLKPLVVVRDIDLIKQITTKDFEYFLDHRSMVEPDIDPLFGRNLVTLKGQEWKDMRSMLSPMFTSSKIRVMVPFMMEVGNQMIESLKKKIKESNENFIDVDSKDLTSRYTNDVIASCAFGLKVNSMVDEDNEFFKMGKIVTNFTPWMLLKVFFYLNMPVIMRILKIKFLPEAASNFFRGIIMGTMEDREKNNIFRPDMIHLMMQARKGRLEHEEKSNSDQDTGFATVEESVVETKTIKKESLRLWTPAVILDRICTKDYNLGKPNDLATQDYIIRKGEGVTLAAWAIHRDPKYFPNPTKFDPERFSEENKHKIVPFSYMPFGLGPRNCIASRFALCELKVMLYQLLLHFEISPCEKTCVPSQLDPTRFTLCLKGGSWIRIKIRE
ncbi:unnamed protein product [Diatraea saccharalis]|uniref:unspecific monooxygenase n=1 Tax=Diatraea saccharalis TaxID=40085 RepID=A0A9P0BZE3_9NEOP|nr:unnamed protein product [Diatraea saccharalis]